MNSEPTIQHPLVTVITTVHDLERYVERCIGSLLEQTYTNWEQIIVDDGSTDRTEERIARFNDPRIRYIRLPHRGLTALAEGYNVALTAGTGPLVAILEGDDFWPRHKLARQVRSFEDADVQLTWGKAIVVDENDGLLRRWPKPALPRSELTIQELFRRLTRANILTPTVTVMVRRSALETIGGFQQPAGALFVDLPTWLKIAANVRGKARMLDALLGYYRVHEKQMSTRYDFEYHTTQGRVVDAIIRELDASTLEGLGWDKSQRRAARASAELTAGIAYLRAGQRRDARATLFSALLGARSPRENLRAALGLVSTVLPYDLVAAADRARRRLLTASLERRQAHEDENAAGSQS